MTRGLQHRQGKRELSSLAHSLTRSLTHAMTSLPPNVVHGLQTAHQHLQHWRSRGAQDIRPGCLYVVCSLCLHHPPCTPANTFCLSSSSRRDLFSRAVVPDVLRCSSQRVHDLGWPALCKGSTQCRPGHCARGPRHLKRRLPSGDHLCSRVLVSTIASLHPHLLTAAHVLPCLATHKHHHTFRSE
jgi:hypothetical protein